ncbi:hypothetical protein TPHA_0E02120 [Tetrapisispora phaffii CBS 4417]|uniref:Inosine/uridine-preferring nucleoside hydrolase domain-containing protein n=1 Tax=Tetrapisispora phaffii (strain ATCC 24235 / CBS 4417 / NBRC 1672 / NRRL Y-8282 / UCD 70-5) TaxID=1071381 RepID=G8BTS6_TETPH|nr:hypothetical protein TPHA_0E02120 [Tetrapisispora phaffii CBS 4417]CCE63304.1 hypothetical protein TPHA_0E02120 [Tetrapisispora phaffii CBS 4417]
MTKEKIPIWLDCDPGHDDAIAILLSCFHPAFKLVGISACYGNASPNNTHYNARSILTAIGKANDIPVLNGAQQPWKRLPIYAPDIHGESGLDGTTLLPVPIGDINNDSYIDYIEEKIEENEGELFISTGSLTSIATVLKEKPHLKKKLKYLAIMGGGLSVGNINENKSAEFNIWVDPDSANFLFTDEVIKNKCIVTPLDLTHKAIATQEVMENILGTSGSNLRRLFYELFLYFGNSYKNAQGFETGPPIHDPLALIPLLVLYGWEPDMVIQYVYKRVDLKVIVDENDADIGKLVILKEYDANDSHGTVVGIDLNYKYFWTQVYLGIAEAEKLSTIELIAKDVVRKELMQEELSNDDIV